MFMLGIDQMSPAEKSVLLAQLNALTGANVLSEGAQRTAKAAKSTVLRIAAHIVGCISKGAQDSIEKLDGRLEWNTDVLKRTVEREVERLSGLPGAEIDRQLQNRLRVIAGVGQNETDEATASAIVHKAARALKVDHHLYTDISALEDAVFEAAVREQVENLKKHLQAMSPEQEAELEAHLNEELARLSDVDREAISRATGIDTLSGRAVLSFIRTTSTVFLVQTIVSSFGFGAFLFLTTVIKACSLLLGVTFSFGVYLGATTTLAFILSGPFLVFSGLLVGGIVYGRTSGVVNSQLAKMLVFVGKERLMAAEASRSLSSPALPS